MKDDHNMKVYIDISMFRYPCGLVSLDIMDVLHSHTLNVKGDLKKVRLNQSQNSLGDFDFPLG